MPTPPPSPYSLVLLVDELAQQLHRMATRKRRLTAIGLFRRLARSSGVPTLGVVVTDTSSRDAVGDSVEHLEAELMSLFRIALATPGVRNRTVGSAVRLVGNLAAEVGPEEQGKMVQAIREAEELYGNAC
jgi:hypothetical protein